jgi:hypothetical protein
LNGQGRKSGVSLAGDLAASLDIGDDEDGDGGDDNKKNDGDDDHDWLKIQARIKLIDARRGKARMDDRAAVSAEENAGEQSPPDESGDDADSRSGGDGDDGDSANGD